MRGKIHNQKSKFVESHQKFCENSIKIGKKLSKMAENWYWTRRKSSEENCPEIV